MGFRVLPDRTTVNEAVHLGKLPLTSMLTPWQRLDAIKTFLFPAMNFAMRVGRASKGEWQRLDDELRPLLKKTLYLLTRATNDYLYGSSGAGTAGVPLAAELSDIARVDSAFKLHPGTAKCVAQAMRDLRHIVERRLRRPAGIEDMKLYTL